MLDDADECLRKQKATDNFDLQKSGPPGPDLRSACQNTGC